MERGISHGGTRSIKIKDVKLLVDAYGTEITIIQTGGDLSPLSTPLALMTHIGDSFMTLSTGASLLRIPTIALFKLVSLSFSTAYLFVLEHFGHLVRKYPVFVPIGKYRHSATFGDMMVIPATQDLWERTSSITDLMNAVNGL